MGLSDQLQEILPTRLSRLSALSTPPATAIAWSIPHIASPFLPKLSQAEIVLLQLSAALALALLGTLMTLVFVLVHQKTLVPMPASIEDEKIEPIELTKDQESVLVIVSKHEPITTKLVSFEARLGQQVALHYLEVMKQKKFVSYYWRNEQWKLLPAGREYLVCHALIT